MIIHLALILSVVLQFVAFIIAISLIPKTKYNIAWISISIGFLLMAFRRFSDLYFLYFSKNYDTLSIISAWIAVVISIAMLIAAIYIRKILELVNKLYRLRKDNETRVLQAVITTEETERRFFSKELHDGLGPILSAMKMTLSAIDISALDENNKEILRRTEMATDSAISTIKEIANHLNPSVLERFGLEKALRTFSETIICSGKINIKIVAQMNNQRLPYNIEIVLYRVICELINNTIKHANASQIDITLFQNYDIAECLYEDNGIGFPKIKDSDSGTGLINIKSRLRTVKGKLTISDSEPSGMYAKISIPLTL